MPLEKLWLLHPILEHHWRYFNSPYTQAHIINQSSIHSSLKWQDDGAPSSKWTKNSRHTSCIHNGLYAGKWPVRMTSKPDAFIGLGYNWTDCAGTVLADAIAQWFSSGNAVFICIIETHHTGRPLEPKVLWDATGTTLADASIQWYPSGNPALICIIGTQTTGSTLETLATKNSFSSGIPMYFGCLSSRHLDCTGLPLN